MTTEHEASRTLVKSPPELWAECSDAGSLARHLGEFGEIKITRLEPETTVAWEGEHASGTVRIEPSGWGTRVTLTAQTEAEDVPEPEDLTPVEAEASGAEEIMPAEVPLPDPDPPTDTEEDDATVEEAVEDPDPVLASDSGAFRIRWRRVKGRMRGLFGPREALGAPEAIVVEEPARGGSVEEPVGSAPPPVEAEQVEAEEPEVEIPTPPEPELAEPEMGSPPPEAAEPELDAEAVLSAALDSLGQAHHRPFSRA
jgi:hypothetical protein